MGFDLPVTDGAAMKEFYTDLGFEPEDVNGNVALDGARRSRHSHRAACLRMPALNRSFSSPIPDAHKAADEWKYAGIKPQQTTGWSSSTIPTAMSSSFSRPGNSAGTLGL